jgi:hypothetical protein
MKESTILPDLRMLPASSLVPHEEVDPRRVEKLSLRLRQEGRLKHPPILAPIPDSGRFVVLDGANRTMALAALQVPHIVAQVVDYQDPGVELDTWYHVVSGMPVEEFRDALYQLPGLHAQGSSLSAARQALAQDKASAYIVCADSIYLLKNSESRQPRDIDFLNKLVGIYKGRAEIFRASNDVWEKQAPFYPKMTALVIFPRLQPQDILAAVRSEKRIPSGITRHIIPNRALNINIPFEVLEADLSLEQKRAWLRDWLMERMAANAIRFYAEPTFTFDE